jgi:hypothetical protein
MPRLSDYAKYATMQQGREVIHGALWDTLLYTSAATVVLNFFQQTIAAVTPDVTIMQNPGQLPYPWQFLVRAIRFFVKQRPETVALAATTNPQTGALNNISVLCNTGLLSITHGAKQYGPYPLSAITAGAGPYGGGMLGNVGVGAPLIASIVDYAQNGNPHIKNVFTLAKPLLIETSMNFLYQLSWPAGAVTLTRNLNLCLCLEGDLIRQVQ